jgi:glycosyltransferase involved in cell wall biosynthesis
MNILILHGTIVRHDAIGNDIYWMAKVLSEKHEVFCYADVYKYENLNFITLEKVFEFISKVENILIYHHSIFWELGEELLRRAKCKIIFKYHNITPGVFFQNYSKSIVDQCNMGRAQTDRLAKKFDKSLWLSDSIYNSKDLREILNGKVVAPFNVIESWINEKENNDIKISLKNSKKLKLLFVGRVAPNKGFKNMIEVICRYKVSYGEDVELFLIGKCYNQNYLLELTEEIYTKNAQNQITFVGEADKSVLKSYYKNCDAFLCLSEHEGFCVPVVEAQYFSLPVVAYEQAAVKETLGENQFVFEKNADLFAAALNKIYVNKAIKNKLIENGKINFENRFSFEKIKASFIEAVAKEGLF